MARSKKNTKPQDAAAEKPAGADASAGSAGGAAPPADLSTPRTTDPALDQSAAPPAAPGASAAPAGSDAGPATDAGGAAGPKIELTVTVSPEVEKRITETASWNPEGVSAVGAPTWTDVWTAEHSTAFAAAAASDVALSAADAVPVIVVRSKSERGRRRAGHAFTREHSTIDIATLSDDQLASIENDPELVTYRAKRPSPPAT